MFCATKKPPPPPQDTEKTHEAQMSSVLKEAYLSSLVSELCHIWMSSVTYEWGTAHMNAVLSLKSRHTRQSVMAHRETESWYTHKQIGAQVWRRHGTHVSHTGESWHTYERVGSQFWSSHVSHVLCMDESWHTDERVGSHVCRSQHTATHCNTLQRTLQHTATHCNTLQHTATHVIPGRRLSWINAHCATHCNTLQHTLQHTATRCDPRRTKETSHMHQHTLQHTATHCNILQHTATHCKTRDNKQRRHTNQFIWYLCTVGLFPCGKRFFWSHTGCIWGAMPVAHKSIRVTPLDCRTLFME